ncbi:MAG: hypothetical protein IJF17_01775 [Thermoguttaceae bacterium]|nr:hypothetical protein [Thermoguttaceae bacterium]
MAQTGNEGTKVSKRAENERRNIKQPKYSFKTFIRFENGHDCVWGMMKSVSL